MTGVRNRGAQEDTGTGGFVKTQRARRLEREGSRKKKTARPARPSKVPLEKWLSDFSKEESAKEKKEGVKMNNSNGNGQPQVPWKEQLRKLELHCPACLGDHAKVLGTIVEDLCTECGQTFINETSTALAQGKLITKLDWMASRLAILEQKLEYARAEFGNAQETSIKEAAEFIDKTIGTTPVLPEVRKRAFQQKKQVLWLEKHGDTKFAIMKGLENRVLQLQTAIDKLPAGASATQTAPEIPAKTTALLVVESAPVAPDPVLTAS